LRQAFFNVMLREAGVKGVKIQELFSIDEEMIAFLPEPVYGLIFLFQFDEDSNDDQEPVCPDDVWFANQVRPFNLSMGKC
jgi:ubiquitin carboxyl-terminal hydrolase L5